MAHGLFTVVHGLLFSCGVQAQFFPQHVGFQFPHQGTKDGGRVPFIGRQILFFFGRQILNHWTTREVSVSELLNGTWNKKVLVVVV